MTTDQLALFSAPPLGPSPPEGLRYEPEVLSAGEEAEVLAGVAALELKPFEFHGFLGNRRTASFGWRYDFNGGGFTRAGGDAAFSRGVARASSRVRRDRGRAC